MCPTGQCVSISICPQGHPTFGGMVGSTRLMDRGRRASSSRTMGKSCRFACARASWRRLLMVDGNTSYAIARSASEYPARWCRASTSGLMAASWDSSVRTISAGAHCLARAAAASSSGSAMASSGSGVACCRRHDMRHTFRATCRSHWRNLAGSRSPVKSQDSRHRCQSGPESWVC